MQKIIRTTVAAGAMLAIVGSKPASAGLSFEVKAARPACGRDYNTGDIIDLQIYANVTGANPGFQEVYGSLVSTQGRGDFISHTIASPFNRIGSSAGTIQDLNGDGDADIGGIGGNGSAGLIAYRASSMATGSNSFLLGTAQSKWGHHSVPPFHFR